MSDEAPSPFPGFPDFRANVTFVPIQFFTVVLPHHSRGCVRIVGYALRKLLGWVDEQGNPTREQLRFTYRELIEQAGVSRDAIAPALQEAVDHHFLRCVQAPRPDSAGQPARSGVYELRWDPQGRYTDSPTEFAGFFYPEAAVVPVTENGTVTHRPKAARKNIPNAFFDHLLRRERLSVIRVVGALLFYSIQWGPGGERKVPVSRSITDLGRLTRFSRQHVCEALAEAVRLGYLVRLESGRFDPDAGRQSQPATYGIHWQGAGRSGRRIQTSLPALPLEPVGNGVPPGPVGKGERTRSEKVNGERSEKVDGTRVKTELNNSQTTAGPEAVRRLRSVGFDEVTAQRLARWHAEERIRRQIEWLPLRNTTRNRLGLLRRAIEEDWPKPEEGGDPATRLGRVFTAHYYAAYHRFTGEPASEALPRDAQAAARFVERLLALDRDEGRVPQWGREFGGFMRDRHRTEAHTRPNLAPALAQYGDAFLSRFDPPRQRGGAAVEAQEPPEGAWRIAYEAWLLRTEQRVQAAQGGLYEAFLERRRRTRAAMTGGVFVASPQTLARFDSQSSRLQAFAEYFRNHPQSPVLDFRQWLERRRRVSVSPTDQPPPPDGAIPAEPSVS
ncbi:MAG: hypothetical protein ACYDC1_18400 [Limisphaerales bacterium]